MTSHQSPARPAGASGSDRAGVAVIGLGRIGQHHALNLARHVPSARLVALVDMRPGVADEVVPEVDCLRADDVEAALTSPDVDAVMICTPAATHLDLGRRALAAGKAVFCEKPIAAELGDALELQRLAEEAGAVFQVGYQRRYDRDYASAVARIRAGELGDVYLLRTSMRDMAPPPEELVREQRGFLIDATGHDFDACRWIGGEIVEVTAFGAALSSPVYAEIGDVDQSVVVFRYASGGLGVIDNSRISGYGFECSTEVMGSKATARIADHRRTNVEWLTPGSQSVDWVGDFIERFEGAYVAELEDFAQAVLGHGEVRVTAADGVASLALSLAAIRSFESDGTTVRVADVLAEVQGAR